MHDHRASILSKRIETQPKHIELQHIFLYEKKIAIAISSSTQHFAIIINHFCVQHRLLLSLSLCVCVCSLLLRLCNSHRKSCYCCVPVMALKLSSRPTTSTLFPAHSLTLFHSLFSPSLTLSQTEKLSVLCFPSRSNSLSPSRVIVVKQKRLNGSLEKKCVFFGRLFVWFCFLFSLHPSHFVDVALNACHNNCGDEDARNNGD